MANTSRLGTLLVSVLALSGVARAERATSTPPLVNWGAPATYAPTGSAKIRALTDISSPVPFITIAPCRQYNSLLATPLAQGVNRAVPLTGAPCNIPASAVAVSVNITVFNITGATGNGVFKVDTVTPPAVAWINYPPTEAQRGNAGVVALNGSGQIIVQVAQGAGQVDFIVDTNGYYASAAANQENTFTVINSGATTVPAILGQTNSTNLNATGVQGLANAATGITNGVVGQNLSSTDGADGVFGVAEASSGITTGVWGRSRSASDNARGVYGEALGTGGRLYGVFGYETGPRLDSAGVRGVDWTGSTPGSSLFLTAGVRGESAQNTGVLGVSQYQAVAGYRLDSGASVISAGFLGYSSTVGVYFQNGLAGTGTKSFVEPHPTDASKVIRYVSLEGPEAGTYFRGTDQTSHGTAVIPVPESFRLVTDTEGLTVQLTPVGAAATMYVVSQDLNQIVVRTSRDVRFHYMVNGVRKAYPHWDAIGENERFFVPESALDRLPLHLSEEERGRLIRNGTYNADGSVNLETAERVGWTKMWAEREARRQTAALEARKAIDEGRR